MRCMPVRYTLMRYTPVRYTPIKYTPVVYTFRGTYPRDARP
jgi:hypothetical protein